MKRVVTIGGGSGQALVLRYLKQYRCDLTALVSMVDNGGSSGRLREQWHVLPPGDVRQCLVALAQCPPVWTNLFSYRFPSGDYQGHTVGNLILTSLAFQTGSFLRAMQLISTRLQVAGTVLPITLQPSTLYARLDNGQIVVGETNIDIPKHDPRHHIQDIYLRPAVHALPQALQAIRQADSIILTIGDLYSSVLPNLLVGGVAAALRRTKARLIYTCNRVTKHGETRGFTALDYVKTINQALGARRVDDIMVDRTMAHDRRTPHLVSYHRAALEQYGVQVSEANLRGRDGRSIDGKKLAQAIAELCRLSS